VGLEDALGRTVLDKKDQARNEFMPEYEKIVGDEEDVDLKVQDALRRKILDEEAQAKFNLDRIRNAKIRSLKGGWMNLALSEKEISHHHAATMAAIATNWKETSHYEYGDDKAADFPTVAASTASADVEGDYNLADHSIFTPINVMQPPTQQASEEEYELLDPPAMQQPPAAMQQPPAKNFYDSVDPSFFEENYELLDRHLPSALMPKNVMQPYTEQSSENFYDSVDIDPVMSTDTIRPYAEHPAIETPQPPQLQSEADTFSASGNSAPEIAAEILPANPHEEVHEPDAENIGRNGFPIKISSV